MLSKNKIENRRIENLDTVTDCLLELHSKRHPQHPTANMKVEQHCKHDVFPIVFHLNIYFRAFVCQQAHILSRMWKNKIAILFKHGGCTYTNRTSQLQSTLLFYFQHEYLYISSLMYDADCWEHSNRNSFLFILQLNYLIWSYDDAADVTSAVAALWCYVNHLIYINFV